MPYTYSWLPGGQTTATISNLCAGTYTVWITNGANCTDSASTTITTQVAKIVPNGTSQPSTNCMPCNGTATCNPTGGYGGLYSYSWFYNGSNNQTQNGLCPNTYMVRVRSWQGAIGQNPYCETFDTIQVGAGPNVPIVTVNSTNVDCNGNGNGTATASVTGGQTPYTYSWAPGGQTTASVSNLGPGTYTVAVTDAGSCTQIKTVTISEPSAINLNTSSTDAKCNLNNGTATATATGGAGPKTYTWTPGNYTTNAISNLAPGSYSVIVTDTNGCSKNATVSINGIPAPVVNATGSSTGCNPCVGTASSSVVGATGPYTFTWTPGNYTTQNVSGLCPSVYTITITDKDGCTDTDTAQVVGPSNLSLNTTSTNVSCNGAGDGTVSSTVSGGGTPYSYSWVPGGFTSQNVSGLGSGCYTVTVTDANNCTLTSSSCVSEPAAINSNISKTNAACGICNGTATVNATGGTGKFTYSWVPGGATTASVSNLCPAKYYVYIKDSTNCTKLDSVTIIGLVAPSASASGSGTSCNPCNGTATVNASGNGPFTYLWSPSGATTSGVANLCAGVYTVTITDNDGCTATDTAHVVGPTNLAATTNCTNITCNGANNGILSANATGGNPAYSYSWVPAGFTSQTVSNVGAGNYTVYVSDQSGCSYIATCSIVNPPAIAGSASATNASSASACDGSATATFTGGTAPLTYTWTPGNATTATITGLCTGNYVVCVTDSKGCTQCDTVTVSFTTGINNNSSNANVALFPNPVKEQLNVIIGLNKSTEVSYQIYNELGQLLLTERVVQNSGSSRTFDTSKLNDGLYYLVIRYGEVHATRKFIINK